MSHVSTASAATPAAPDPAAARPTPAGGGPDRSERAAGMSLEELADLQARFFRTLGDPTRIRILRLLSEAPAGECGVGELVAAINAPQSRVSTHLGCLRWCGLVRTRREGKQVFYRVADPRVDELLALGNVVMRDHAAEVASCDVIG